MRHSSVVLQSTDCEMWEQVLLQLEELGFCNGKTISYKPGKQNREYLEDGED